MQTPPPLPPKPPSKSIGSKIAATFSHSRLPKPSQPEPAPPSTLTASTSRPASYESGSSGGSWPRSTTPRPSQPLITVSLSPDNLSEYKNLFTRPPPQDSDVTPNPTPPPTSRLPKFDSPIYPRRGQTPASAIAAAHRQATSDSDDRSPSRSSRYSRKNSDSDKGHEETPGPSGSQESPRATTDGEKGLPPSLQRVIRSAQSSENANSPSIRSRMKLPSNSIRSGPPSIPLPQTPSSPPPSNMTATLSPPSADIPEANFDIDTASLPELRAALRTRNQQYEELSTYVLKVTNLEKKVLTLEKEVARKDKELKGLRWIINNGDSSQPQPLSTAASGSDSESSFRHRSLRKPSTLAEVTYNFCHTGSTRRPSKMPPGLGAEKVLEMPNKRSSLSSVSPSPSSSTSSLLPPSPSITMSSLSAIPEGPPSALRPSLRYDNSDQEERRALRASHRASTSSMTSSSTAASSAYSGNIKRSRPPSIAQVLEKSPIMDDVLEKLRPFA